VGQGSGDGLAFDGTYLYYLSGNWDQDTLYVLDPDDGGVVASHALPDIDFSMFGQGLAYLNGMIYLLDWGAVNQDIVVVNPATGALVETIDFDGVNSGAPKIGAALGSIRGPDALLVSTFDASLPGKILEVDPATGLITNSFDHGLPHEEALGLTSMDGKIYMADHTAPGVPFHDHILIFDRDGTQVGSLTVTDPPSSVLGLQSLAGSGEVPEPSSLALAAVALAGLGLHRSRRRK
jgi:MYXO-CTERM domain-containing protein